jgi:hypothetical protein
MVALLLLLLLWFLLSLSAIRCRFTPAAPAS